MVAVVAIVAGGTGADAVRLGLSMTLLQFTIGTVNDLEDARADAGRKPGKPIPSRSVRPTEARVIAVAAAAGGLALAAVSPVMILLAVVVLGIGLAYDLFAKGTAASWVPFAVGIPILPVYGWLGATGSLPDLFRLLVPVAAVGGRRAGHRQRAGRCRAGPGWQGTGPWPWSSGAGRRPGWWPASTCSWRPWPCSASSSLGRPRAGWW